MHRSVFMINLQRISTTLTICGIKIHKRIYSHMHVKYSVFIGSLFQDMDELKLLPIEAWPDIHQSVIDQAIDQCLNACVDAKGNHIEHTL